MFGSPESDALIPREKVVRAGESISVAFRSAKDAAFAERKATKDAAFAERKATMRHLLIRRF
jgi:hypothetical protein